VVEMVGIGTMILKIFRQCRNELQEHLERRETCSFETTLAAHAKTYMKILNYAKNKGFKLYLLYVGLSSAELAIKRVKSRVTNGGHGVTEKMIIKRYDRSLNTLHELISEFDFVSLYDNSGDSLVRIYQRIGNRHFMSSELPNWSKEIIAHDNL
ncbi:hypothetical protein ACKI2C_47335, partial [Streptomyces brasiliscabiei]